MTIKDTRDALAVINASKVGPEPDTHYYDDDTGRDEWCYSAGLMLDAQQTIQFWRASHLIAARELQAANMRADSNENARGILADALAALQARCDALEKDAALVRADQREKNALLCEVRLGGDAALVGRFLASRIRASGAEGK